MEKIAVTSEFGGRFFDIREEGEGLNSSYGGNQDWFSRANLVGRKTSARMANTGCGAVSAANIICHISQNTAYGKGIVKVPSKQDFCHLATQMYFIYTPQTMTVNFTPSTSLSLGIWYVESVIRGVVHYASSKGVQLRGYSCNTRNSDYDAAARFIITALSANSPVVLLVYYNNYIRSLGLKYMSEMHFVTITGAMPVLGMDGNTEDYELIISNHGMRQEIPSLKRLWNAYGIYVMPKASLAFAAKKK